MKYDLPINKLYLLFEKRLSEIKYQSGFDSANQIKFFFKKLEPEIIVLTNSGVKNFINQNDKISAYAIMNPVNDKETILINREIAKKILVLGLP